ncbi:MAG: alpha/beta hydrolase, partial [Chloroflexi bacterium]|nr:alpha/beta hydrolase [Chloroflexota bacterium]
FVVNSQRGIRGYRAPVAARAGALAEMKVPLLLLVGDHDEAALEPMLAAYRAIPIASLGVLPNSGHPINIEEPALFNSMVETFLRRVESGAWHASLE